MYIEYKRSLKMIYELYLYIIIYYLFVNNYILILTIDILYYISTNIDFLQ